VRREKRRVSSGMKGALGLIRFRGQLDK
jgi:hypothetical protein